MAINQPGGDRGTGNPGAEDKMLFFHAHFATLVWARSKQAFIELL